MAQNAWMNVESLFHEISRDWFEKNDLPYESAKRSGVFSAALTVWLMMLQRLCGLPLEGALIEMLRNRNRSALVGLNQKSKKLAFGDVSLNSGGFSRARDRVELDQICDLVKHCESKLRQKLGDEDSTYLLDGHLLNDRL